MSSSTFVLIVFTFMPHFATGGAGDVQRSRTPVITMQEFGSEQACLNAKQLIKDEIDTSNAHRSVQQNPYWRIGHSYNAHCVPQS